MEKLIADISEHEIRTNGFDPKKLAQGFDGVMLRLGWAGYNGELGLDDGIEENVLSAAEAGLDVGLYLYCYCKNPAAANTAAKRAADFADRVKAKITLPTALMVSETHLPCLIGQGKDGLTDTVAAFLFETGQSGYQAMFATYTAFARTYLDMSRLSNRDLWITDYRMDEKTMQRQLGREDYGMWRYKKGVSRCFKNYPAMAKERMKSCLISV